jgi:DNA-binding NarL/FixJ family response regulator
MITINPGRGCMLEILVADDHEVTRQGVRGVLEAEPNWRVCGQASDGREAVELAARFAPDIAILDLTMPTLNGLDAARQILKVSPSTKVLIFADHDSEQLPREVLAAGAHGYVLKTEAANDLVHAVAALSTGAPYLGVRMARVGVDSTRARNGTRNQVAALTAREREITQLLAEGKSNERVATILGISIKTVETHRANIMQKLGLASIVELVHYAVRNQIVSP